MPKLSEYYDSTSTLENNYEALCDPALSVSTDRQQVNDLVLNFVIKYLARYLDLDEKEQDTNLLRRNIKERVKKITGALLQEYDGEGFSLGCLMDIRKTAALVKEIAFNDRFKPEGEKPNDFFRSVDFGSGTGILLIASLIAARRKDVHEIVGLGFEREEGAINKANSVLSGLLSEKREFATVIKADITDPNTFIMLERESTHFWISETIDRSIPRINVQGTTLSFKGSQQDIAHALVEETKDPFIRVLQHSLTHIPDFEENVKNGSIAMFPDLFNGDYEPNVYYSKMTLKTGGNISQPLMIIGEEFNLHEDLELVSRRW